MLFCGQFTEPIIWNIYFLPAKNYTFIPERLMNGKMSVSRNGTLEKPVSLQTTMDRGELDFPHPRLHHTGSISSSTPANVSSSDVVVPPPYSVAGSAVNESPLELRGSLDCWACSVLVTAQNLIIAALNVGLAAFIFGLILLPSLVMVVFGFLCHSTVSF